MMRLTILSILAPSILAVTAAAPATAQSTIPGLENFTLERPQSPQPTPVPTVTPPPPSPSPSPTATARPTAQPTTPTPTFRATPQPRVTATTPAVAAPSPTPSPAETASPTEAPSETPPTPIASETATPPTEAAPTESSDWLLWALLGVAALALLAGFAWWRSRSRDDYSADDYTADDPFVVENETLETPASEAPVVRASTPARSTDLPSAPPAPAPPTPPPPPSPPPAPARPGGLVTSSLLRAGGPGSGAPGAGGLITSALMPDLRLTLRPLRGGVDALRATVEYELQVGNVGRGAARAVTVESWLISAGHETASDLATLFARPPGQPMLRPFDLLGSAAIDLSGVGVASRDALAVITAGDRRSFVPVLAVRVSFVDGRGTPQAINAAYLIGVERAGQERLAPLPLDRGARMHENLGARPFDA